ncbi:MAG TPA: hypothetical protein VM261_15975 [Kofleriaceae bacterium]|nr:hypothetical protein [Kofleriaceae bacterium]
MPVASRALLVLVCLAACVTPPDDDPGLELDAGVVADVDASAGTDTDTDAATPPANVEPTAAARPAIAGGAGTQLVVWDTHRNGTTDIYGARLDANGRVLDPDGLSIAVAPGTQITPRVAFNGTLFLVVWKDNRAGRASIVGARVRLDGTVLDPAGVVIAADGGTTQLPDVASDGTDFLVVWEGPCAGCVHGVSGATVSGAGVVGAARRLAPVDALSYTPAVAYSGGTYLVTWAAVNANGDHDVHGRLVSRSAAPGADVAIAAAPGNQIIPAVAGNGASFFVVWQDTRSGDVQTYGARVAATGTVLDGSGLALSTSGRWHDRPAVVHTTAGYVASWTEPSGADDVVVCTHLVGAGGAPSATSRFFAAASAGGSPLDDDKQLVLAAAGDRVTVAWQTSWEGDFTVVGARIRAANEVLAAPATLSTSLVVP